MPNYTLWTRRPSTPGEQRREQAELDALRARIASEVDAALAMAADAGVLPHSRPQSDPTRGRNEAGSVTP